MNVFKNSGNVSKLLLTTTDKDKRRNERIEQTQLYISVHRLHFIIHLFYITRFLFVHCQLILAISFVIGDFLLSYLCRGWFWGTVGGNFIICQQWVIYRYKWIMCTSRQLWAVRRRCLHREPSAERCIWPEDEWLNSQFSYIHSPSVVTTKHNCNHY